MTVTAASYQGTNSNGMLFADEDNDEADLEYATAIADVARGLMAKHGIPPTPHNFTVWFEYALGTSPEFKKTIDVLIAGRRPFDASTNRDLYLAYARSHGAGDGFSGDVSDRLQEVLTKAAGYLATAISGNRTHAQSLGGVASRAKSGGDPVAIIASLMKELSTAATRASTLEVQLAESSKEVDDIRKSLHHAEQRATTDALTGLANRHAFDSFLRTAQVAAMEKGEPLSMLLIDIDHFKNFNDTFGHQTGDHVLRLIAQALKEGVRASDMAARFGGEELIAVMPCTDLAACRDIAERIRCTISERPLVRRATGETLARITASIGVAQFDPGEPISSLFERCDRALYMAKRMGRNRTVTELELDVDIVAA